MITLRMALLPRDGLSCKDGRGWYTSDVGRSRAHPWPLPATIRGALRAAFGREAMARTGAALSPEAWREQSEAVSIRRLVTLHRSFGSMGSAFAPEHRRWPAPADARLVRESPHAERLVPKRGSPDVGTLGAGDDDAVEALWRAPMPRGKPVPGPAFWTDEEMTAWLRGQAVQKRDADDPKRTPARRTDIHLAIDPATGAATPTMLHSNEITEGLGDGGEWAIAVEVEVPDASTGMAQGPLLIGGKRCLAPVEAVEESLFDPPARLPPASRGLRLVLATPAEFERGCLPDGFAVESVDGTPTYTGTLPGVEGRVVLRAAMVPRPIALSTWDMVARAPRATRSLVAPGSVLFFEKLDGAAFTEAEIRGLWLARLGHHHHEGLGLVLPGAWDGTT